VTTADNPNAYLHSSGNYVVPKLDVYVSMPFRDSPVMNTTRCVRPPALVADDEMWRLG